MIAHNPGYAGVRIDLDRLQALQGDAFLEVDLMVNFHTIEDADHGNHGDDNARGNKTGDTNSRK